jgi:hypothetical protein
VVSFTTRPLYPWGKNPQYQLDRRLGGPQSRSGRRGEEKILDPTGTRTSTPWPVAIPATLSRFLVSFVAEIIEKVPSPSIGRSVWGEHAEKNISA